MRRSMGILFLLALLWFPLPFADAQQTNAPGNPPQEEHSPALPFAMATIFSMIILTIVCMPTRKG